MHAARIATRRLELVPSTPEEAREHVAAMSASDRAQLSADWLERLRLTTTADPWVLGFTMVDQTSGNPVGSCGFKGPPDANGTVEIAYGVAPEHQNRGYATEAAGGLVQFAFADTRVRVVCAHTLSEANASARVLVKCGFIAVGQVVDPEDGLVWRWETIRARHR
jgi:[ribosomal protein S5]-alanine N-acetyltransferase